MPDADVQMVMQGVSLLPEDRFINTLHFSESGVGSFDSFASVLAVDLKSAWDPLGGIYPTEQVIRPYQILIYNPDDPKPRKPWVDSTGAVPTGTLSSGSSGSLPTEVALCLSYYGISNTKRNRGRIFIGPVQAGWNDSSRPLVQLRTALLDLADRLSDVGTQSVDWQIVSRVAGTRQRIQEVWVDNAWDTQRRRGIAPTARSTRAVSG